MGTIRNFVFFTLFVSSFTTRPQNISVILTQSEKQQMTQAVPVTRPHDQSDDNVNYEPTGIDESGNNDSTEVSDHNCNYCGNFSRSKCRGYCGNEGFHCFGCGDCYCHCSDYQCSRKNS